jgi:hypothetical protein
MLSRRFGPKKEHDTLKTLLNGGDMRMRNGECVDSGVREALRNSKAKGLKRNIRV